MGNIQKNIGFSFSGGAARAAAHIGMIQALNEAGIKASRVVGTSGGAIAATLYAAGLSVEEMKAFAAEGNLLKIYKAELPFGGFTSLEYLGELLEKFIGKSTFEEMDIPLFVVASDIMSGRKKIFDSGALFPAVQASCSVPLIFKPVEIDGQLYADGGIFDNMPVEPLLYHCDFVLGMNVMPINPVPANELDGMIPIGMRVFDIAIAHNSMLNYYSCDAVIEPKKVSEYMVYDFGASAELIEIGYEAGKEKVKDILNKLVT